MNNLNKVKEVADVLKVRLAERYEDYTGDLEETLVAAEYTLGAIIIESLEDRVSIRTEIEEYVQSILGDETPSRFEPSWKKFYPAVKLCRDKMKEMYLAGRFDQHVA